jgi:K+-sensing histidine kinase KdpD
MVWRAPAPQQARAVALATAVAIIVWMAVNKVWNPQYVLWVFAAGALTAMPARLGVILGGISILDYGFEFVLRLPDQTNPFNWVDYLTTLARTAIFAVMVAWAIGQLRELVAGAVPSPARDAPAHSRA